MEKELSSKNVAHKLLRDSNIQDFDLEQLTGSSRLSVVENLSPEELAELLLDEELASQALILAHVDARKSFQTLEELPVKMRSQILSAISKLTPTTPETLNALELKLTQKIQQK